MSTSKEKFFLFSISGNVADEFDFSFDAVVTASQKDQFEKAYAKNGGTTVGFGNMQCESEEVDYDFTELQDGDKEVLERLNLDGKYSKAYYFLTETIADCPNDDGESEEETEGEDSESQKLEVGTVTYVKIKPADALDDNDMKSHAGTVLKVVVRQDGDFEIMPDEALYDKFGEECIEIVFFKEADIITEEEYLKGVSERDAN